MSNAMVMAGVAGSPIEHSLSPVIHEAAFHALGLAWRSERFLVGLGQGADFVTMAKERGLRGFSVTMPLKSELLDLVDWVDSSAWRLQSINCVAIEDDQTTGYSTDGEGFINWLRYDAKFEPKDRHCVIIGAGGAARAVAAALADAGAAKVGIMARRHDQVERACVMVGAVCSSVTEEDLEMADLVVNATPQGMAGTAHADSMPCDPRRVRHDAVAVDLVYEPLETAWMLALRSTDHVVFGGLGMLIHQAAIQIELWTGAEAPIPEMVKAINAVMGERQ